MRPIGRFLAMLAVVLFGGWGGGAAAGAEWRLPSSYPDGSLPVEVLHAFAASLSRHSSGGFRIGIVPSGGKARNNDVWGAVRRGAAPAGDLLGSSLHGVHPIFLVDSMPFLATDYAAARRLYQAARPFLEQRLGEQGVQLLYAVPWPPQGLFTDRPVESAAALRGVRLRTYNALTERLAALLGAQASHIAGSDLGTVLPRRQVQAMITSAAFGVDSGASSHFSHYYDLRAWLPLNLTIANRAAVERLTAEERTALMKAAAEAEEFGWRISSERHDSYLGVLAAKGMTVQAPSPRLADDLRLLGGALADEWLLRVGADGVAVISAFAR